jgi:hypothetical protein
VELCPSAEPEESPPRRCAEPRLPDSPRGAAWPAELLKSPEIVTAPAIARARKLLFEKVLIF